MRIDAAWSSDVGLSLLELVIAMAVTLLVIAGVAAIVTPLNGSLAVAPEAVDMQQRLRVAHAQMLHELTFAGAGASLGSEAGPLVLFLPPILPFRRSAAAMDLPDTVRTDAITILSVPQTASQSTLIDPMSQLAPSLRVEQGSGCPPVELCGFTSGMSILVYGHDGAHDTFEVTRAGGGSADVVASRPEGLPARSYTVGAKVVEISMRTIALKRDTATGSSQLVWQTGSGSELPLVDHVVGLQFEYSGEPLPPQLVQENDQALPKTTYGPLPPAQDEQRTAYPPGENCVFSMDQATGRPVSRLTALAADRGLVPLSAAQLSDGPWCPDALSVDRWDADLLRIRRVIVSIRVEASVDVLRGPAGALFARAGSARAWSRYLPDQEIRLQVTPRNLSIGR